MALPCLQVFAGGSRLTTQRTSAVVVSMVAEVVDPPANRVEVYMLRFKALDPATWLVNRVNPVAVAALRDQLDTYWQRALAGYADTVEHTTEEGQ